MHIIDLAKADTQHHLEMCLQCVPYQGHVVTVDTFSTGYILIKVFISNSDLY